MSSQTSTAPNPEPDHEAIVPGNTVEQLVEGAAQVLGKPRMRGWIHFYSAWLAVITGATLVSVSWAAASPRAGHSTLIYAAATVVLCIVWGGALAGIALKVCWPTAPRWLGVPLYLLLGWVAIWYAPTILHQAGVAAMVLLAVGGVLYSVGGIFYALRWPDPWPSTFGYHEFFHALTAIAAILHYIAMWFAVFYTGDHAWLATP
ncbi:hemolysin III family protein [Mycobacterium avium]|uniref:hemolysin III family protein n=1 Tax=Mycobacterium avium TaxID=1764 RepID=UPI00030671C9|nr:hemolysin III family protein [Mycobacterium avium]AZP80581.1 hemolysin III family protein [Mycobacterium avium subsp. paratuberculosis]WPS77565.1 hemolysin III family protein [Mycobacterium avium subsp. paratuberculosis]